MKVGDIFSQDEILALQAEGHDRKAINKLASQQHRTNIKATSQQPQTKPTPIKDYILNSDDTAAKVARGLGTTGLRTVSMLDFGAEKLGFDLSDDKKVDTLLQKLDDKKESTSRATLPSDRLVELEQLDSESQKASSVWDNVKAGANKMIDVATHPSEWTTQGVVEGTTDPLNLVSFGAGSVAAKFGTTLLSKVAFGGGAGAIEGAVVNSAGEYAVERGRGKSEDEATKVAIQSASGGAVAGASFGSMGGAWNGVNKTSQQNQNNVKETSQQSQDDILSNPLLHTDEQLNNSIEDGIINDPFSKATPKVDPKFAKDVVFEAEPKEPNFTLVHENLPAVLNELVNAEIVEVEVAKAIEAKHTMLLENDAHVMDLKGWSESIGQDVIDAMNSQAINRVNAVEKEAREFKARESQLLQELVSQGAKPSEVKEQINNILTPSENEAKVTLIINDGNAIENKFAGWRLGEYLDESIKNPRFEKEEFNNILTQAGASENLAKVASDSYASKNITLFDDYVANELAHAQALDNDVTMTNVKGALAIDDIETTSKQYRNSVDTMLKQHQEHKQYNDLLDFTRELEYSDTLYKQNEVSAGKLDGIDNYIDPTYEPNYAHGFSLSKAKVKRIEEGRATLEDLNDLKNDLAIMEQDKNFNPPELESFDELVARLNKESPANSEEALSLFGNEEILNDTNTIHNLERDRTDSRANDTIYDSNVKDGTAELFDNDRLNIRGSNERVEDRAKSSDSVPRSDTSSIGERSDNELHQQNETDGSTQGASGSEHSARSDRADETRTSFKRGAEQPANENVNKRESSKSDTSSDTDGIKQGGSGLDFEQKLKLQELADEIEVSFGDEANIARTLPIQLPHQHTNTLKAEKRFFQDGKKGMMFTDGTGTGKTYTGAGIAKRFFNADKKNILIVTPTDIKVKDWIADSKNLQLPITQLKGISDAGSDVVATTYANFRDNNALLKRDFDLIVYDESHYIMQDGKGKSTSTTQQHLRISNGGEFPITQRAERRVIPDEILDDLSSINKDMSDERVEQIRSRYWDAKKELSDEIDAEIVKIKENDVKVVFLSATPFKGHFNLDYAMGYLFDVGAEDGTSYNSGNGRDRFYIENFGYKMRYNKLTRPDAEVNVAVMEQRFSDKLKESGAMSGYTMDIPQDYSREFVKIGLDDTDRMSEALESVMNYDNKKYEDFRKFVNHRFWDYLESNQMYEGMKAKYSIPLIKKHLDSSKQIIIFHRYNSEATTAPFNFANYSYVSRSMNGKESLVRMADDDKALAQYQEFKKEFSDVVGMDGFDTVQASIKKEFGDDVVLFNGKVPKATRAKNVKAFNSGAKKIIIIQEQAGKEGISLHDIDATAQRVLMNFALPYDPIAGIQIEGRSYRLGTKSDAIYQYPILGFKIEEYQFGSIINKRLGTTENLALGTQARALADSFKESFMNSIDESVAHLSLGKGGKALDRNRVELSQWDLAISDYFTNAKKTSKNKASEGADYFATPEPLGFKMVEWADIKKGNEVLEPSAGHGAIARYFPDDTTNRMIEPSSSLVGKLTMRASGDIVNSSFESHNIINKYDTIVMNPPFGTAGKTAMDHLSKAYQHLKEGGRVVAIIPDGNSMRKRLDKWLYAEDEKGKLTNSASFVAEVLLPASTFERAGTKVIGRVVIIDKAEAEYTKTIDLRDIQNNKELFERLENMELPARKIIEKDAELDLVKLDQALNDERIEIVSDVDTRDNSTLYLAKLKEQLERADFNRARAKAKEFGGYWSSFKEAFIFKDESAANKFKSEGC
ncbi:MAG: methyltransferase [Helicobacteraceae bacterium]|nr:methyltransferase [Helicobacteraceae bacterium]